MAQPFQTTFVLFVDMLGFAALVKMVGAAMCAEANMDSTQGYRILKKQP